MNKKSQCSDLCVLLDKTLIMKILQLYEDGLKAMEPLMNKFESSSMISTQKKLYEINIQPKYKHDIVAINYPYYPKFTEI